MFTRLGDAEGAVAQMAAQLDPALLSTADAAAVLVRLTRLRNGVEGMMTLLAARAADSDEFARRGHRRREDWLATVTGTSPQDARRQLDTSRQLETLPATTARLKDGTLSPAQARTVAEAAAASPAAEQGLLATAARDNLEGLHQHAERVKAGARSAEEDAARLQRLHRARSAKRFEDPDGAGVLRCRLTPDVMALVWGRLQHDVWDHDKHHPPSPDHPKDTYAAKLADAVVRAITGQPATATTIEPSTAPNVGPAGGAVDPAPTTVAPANANIADGPAAPTIRRGGQRPDVTVNVLVDWTALIRGHTTDGETCELAGQGPIPVTLARMLADDAYLRVLLTNGTSITTIAHASRYIPAHLRTALEIRDTECAIAGCHHTTGLQIDHNLPIEAGGPTALWNLHRLCWTHHLHKTISDLRLHGPPGQLQYVTPAEWEAAQTTADNARGAA